jgi:FAD/FMN-containing dehydrogenase
LADVVTAEGEVLTASDEVNDDLFWALRGGGGNFGVVTSFEYRLHPVREIYGGPMLYELDDAATVLRFYRDFIREAPGELGGFPAWQIYINFMAGDDQDRIRVNYRENYDRLAEVKRKYDPNNLFHINQNIRP